MAPSPPYQKTEPIAIVGIGCRLPGGASDTCKLWDLLVEGRSGQCEIPKSRFNSSAFYNKNIDAAGTINNTGGYFLEHDARLFDNAFFGINNLEAKYMDPQQRQLLEVVYECFENAGATLENLSGSNTGCYVANFTTDFVTVQAKGPELYHHYSATGFGPTILANRISHAFNLQGPSLVVDTACSSSLYAVHLACTALNAGECDAAVVAGANLVQSPEAFIAMAKAGVLSSTSTSHTFDIAADGYGRGEGIAALYLKRADKAQKDADPIRSLIRGTAVNSNGHTPGITVPSVSGQEAVIRKAYAMAGLPTDETAYVEAHGTGTPVGDPIEVEALSNVIRPRSGHPLLIGSVKTNLGHGEAVSGITSIIKACLSLQHQVIPPTIGVQNINPNLRLSERNMEVVTNVTPWPTVTVRRISINGFGYGGANAHIVLEAGSECQSEDGSKLLNGLNVSNCHPERSMSFLLPLSARSSESLTNNMKVLLESQIPSRQLRDLAYTLGFRRTAMPWRSFLIATEKSSNAEFVLNPRSISSPISEGSKPFAFVFTGQGAQWPGVGRELLGRFPLYRRTIQSLDEYLRGIPEPPSWSLEDTLLGDTDVNAIDQASRAQPICMAIQIALIELLQEWGVKPKATIGHSSGEIAAAYAAGHLNAKEAIAIAYYRGLAVSDIKQNGAMMVVGLHYKTVDQIIGHCGLSADVRVACVNSPASTTISGKAEAVKSLLDVFQERNIFARLLRTDKRAYHSHLVEPAGKRYQNLIDQILSPEQHGVMNGDVTMFSSVTTETTAKDATHTSSYWRINLESPVRFSEALERLLLSGTYHLIELGPHAALAQPIRDTQLSLTHAKKSNYSSTLIRGKNGELTLLGLAGSLYSAGFALRLDKINDLSFEPELSSRSQMDGECPKASGFEHENGGLPNGNNAPQTNKHGLLPMASRLPKHRVLQELPSYSWSYSKILWCESRVSSEYRNQKYGYHELLGTRISGSPGKSAWWRNNLKMKEVPWIQDHKLGQTPVFPAAGYIAMAIEGFRQLHDYAADPVISVKDVHLANLLVLQPEKEDVELCLRLEPLRISGIASSGIWWFFEIASHSGDSTTMHANGQISIKKNVALLESRFTCDDVSLERQAIRTWYNKLTKEGLSFGPEFKSLTEISTDRNKRHPFASGRTLLRQTGHGHHTQQASYIVHPINIDSLLQTAIIASSQGVVGNLHGKVPVLIGQLDIVSQPPLSSITCNIRAQAERVGFETAILAGELENDLGTVIAQIHDVRVIPYAETSLQVESNAERDPTIRILWKPDLSLMTTKDANIFERYIDHFVSLIPNQPARPGLAQLAGALDLATHHNGRMDILELDDVREGGLESLIGQLNIGSSPKRFASFTRASVSSDGQFTLNGSTHGEALKDGSKYDLVVVSSVTLASRLCKDLLEPLRHYLAANVMLILLDNNEISKELDGRGYFCLSAKPKGILSSVTLAKVVTNELTGESVSQIKLVHGAHPDALDFSIQDALCAAYQGTVDLLGLEDVTPETIPPGSVVITTIEFKGSILTNISDRQMHAVQLLTEHASILFWITGGTLYKASNPEHAAILGLSRSLMLERPSLRMPVLDVEPNIDPVVSSHNVVSILNQVLHSPRPDFEYRQYKGVLYKSRFVQDVSLNKRYRQAEGAEPADVPAKEAKNVQLAIKNVGRIETLRFTEIDDQELIAGYVEVQVKAVGINAKDFYALSDKIDIHGSTCALEFSGIINAVGAGVSLVPGDRVVVMAPGHFATLEYVPEWACYKLRDDEDFAVTSTVPLAFSTALHAFEDLACLEQGQSVLIHSATGGVGVAAVQIAQLLRAEIYATVGTNEKRQFLKENFGIPDDHIFSSHDDSFYAGIMKATSDRGVDVVLNSLTGDLLHTSWQACAEFGTFIEIGKRDISDGGHLNMAIFKKNTTFTSFDLTNLYWSDREAKRRTWHRLLYRSMDLFRSKKIQPVNPIKVFPASEIVQAFRYFSLGTRIGKVAVSFEDTNTLPIVPSKYRSSLSPDKAYLLVGCLGGLGRSLSRWLLQRGARHFIFIGRSGTDRPASKVLVENLEASGATVQVVRGSVADYSVVKKAIYEAPRTIGGIIQAAMSINVALFNSMTSDTWHSGIDQKIRGTWNLHNALHGRDQSLDFFLMLSSITGSIGTATESNYCAANSFLDAFGSYRRSLGLPGTSLGLGMISEVGFLHENPETEAVLLRKGVHPFTEAEFLRLVDIALTTTDVDPASTLDYALGNDHFIQGHILTGLELHGFQRIREEGFKRGTKVLEDPRCTFIAGAFADSIEGDGGGRKSSKWSQAVSAALAENKSATVPGEDLIEAIQAVVVDRIATLLLVPSDQLRRDTPLAGFGMESMLAAEFRSDMFRAFKVDVPFAVLLSGTTTVGTVAELVGKGLLNRRLGDY